MKLYTKEIIMINYHTKFLQTIGIERIPFNNIRTSVLNRIWKAGDQKASGKLNNKVIIITGASSGIGKALALELASQEAKVVLASRNIFRLSLVEKEISKLGGTSMSVIADVTNKSDCKYIIDQTIERFGKIDILINNAGISMRALFNELDISVFEKVLDTNFLGAVYCTKYALPYILKQKGSLVAISSISGLTPLPARSAYVASKYAMDGFFQTIRLENNAKGLHVLIVHPGFTSSNIRTVALNKHGESQEISPRNEDKMMSASRLAKVIVKATIKRKRKLILTSQGKLLVWMHKHIPALTDKLIYRSMVKEPDAPF